MEGDVEMSTADNGAGEELDEMKKRLKEMEDESAALLEMQMGSTQDPAAAAASQVNKEEVDSRSVFVGNVDYSCTPEEVQQHFQACGTVNRITIRTNKFGQPKGYAYVEFLEPEAVQEALLLNESELHGRQIKVSAKRTNVPGMKQFRARRPNPYMGFRGQTQFMPAPYFIRHMYMGSFQGLGHPCVIAPTFEMSHFWRHVYLWSGIEKCFTKSSGNLLPVWIIAFPDPFYHEIMLLEGSVAEILIINFIIVFLRVVLNIDFKFLRSSWLQLNG